MLAGASFEDGAGGVKDINHKNVGGPDGRTGEALEPAAEVHIPLRQLLERAVLLLNELHEDRVPYLDEATAVAVGVAFLAELRIVRQTEVVEYF